MCHVDAWAAAAKKSLPNRRILLYPGLARLDGTRPMVRQRSFLLFVAVATVAAMPAIGQTPSAAGPSGEETQSAASIPDFSRAWTHPVFPWFEPPASGPGPITNLSRWAEQPPSGVAGSAALPPRTLRV